MHTIVPPYLQPGDAIGILSTARTIDRKAIQPAVDLLENRQFRVKVGSTIGAEQHQFAGRDQLRANDLQAMLDDPEIKAIYCAKGGYGTIRIIDRLDFSGLIHHPKWIAGFSDVTVLHAHLNNCLNMASIHCQMAGGLSESEVSEEAIQTLEQAFAGELASVDFPAHSYNQSGANEGLLIGGNLSILYNLIGARDDFDPRGKILFLEEVDEYLYHLDRMLWALKRAHKLDGLNGILIGGMTDMNDNEVPYGKDAEAILHEHLSHAGIPVAYGFPAGHGTDNRAFYLGQKVRLEVGDNGSRLVY